MRSTLWWLGLIFGTLSVMMLIKQGFDYGFVAPLQLMLDWYEQATRVLFGWAEPWLRDRISSLAERVGVDQVALYPHWRHVFILLWLFLGAGSRNAWVAGDRVSALVRAVWGIIVATITAVLAGAVRPDTATESLLVPAIAVLGMLAYGLGHSVWSALTSRRAGETRMGHFGLYFGYYIRRALVGVLVILAAVFVAEQATYQQNSSFGLVVLFVLFVLLGLYWLWLGGKGVMLGEKRPGWTAMKENGAIRLGLMMLGAMVGAAVFVTINVGLQLAGIG